MSENIASLCKQITHGVYIIGVGDGNTLNAFTAAWVMQVSFDPILLAFSINPKHYSYQLLQKGGICSINVLSRDQLALAAHFGRPGLRDKMAAYEWTSAITGAPVLSEALCYFDCKVSHDSAAGDHQLVVCRVIDAKVLNKGEPMLYCDTDNMDGSDEIYS
jgi:flavin reductase (DIM6/NTAB) family NADH-FMN oxidoreductase RutF